MRITKDAIERVKRSHDLVEVVQSRGVKLRRKGRYWVGLCPFHNDRNRSFVVDPGKQLWNCLGACGNHGGKSGGDVIAFILKMDGLTFAEALKALGHREPASPGKGDPLTGQAKDVAEGSAVLSVPDRGPDPLSRERRDALHRVVEHYHRVFREKSEGQNYLAGRGLSDPEMLTAFRVGYADGSLLQMLGDGDRGSLKEIGLLTAKGQELLLGCVVFPLSLPELGVVGLYGRHVKRDQHLYLPGPRRGVFHWEMMKGSQEVILTESVLDALVLFQAGFRNVSAIYGIHGFTADHADLLQRFRVKDVLLCLDNDEAGSGATQALTVKLQELGIRTLDLWVAGAKDPNELLLKLGPEATAKAFRQTLEEGRNRLRLRAGTSQDSRHSAHTHEPPQLIEKNMEREKTAPVPESRQGSPSTAGQPPDAGKPQVSREEGGGWRVVFGGHSYRVRGLMPTGLNQLRVNIRVDCAGLMHVETFDLYSQRSRSIWLKEAARELRQDEAEMSRELSDLIEILEGLRLELLKNGEKAAGTVQIPDQDREEALRVLRSPDLLDQILADFERVGFVGERTALSVIYLATISRLLEEPLGVFTVSRSGAGKSSLQEAVCDFVPDESLAKYTRVTGQALFYKDPESLVHKVLAVDEEKGATEAGYSLRILLSAQALSIAATRTDPQTGKLRTEEYKVEGPVAILLTTAAPEAMDFETRNRFVQVGIDESAEQTRRILERQREMDTLEGVVARQRAQAIRRRQQNVQRLLRPLQVVNPYAHLLTYPDQLLQMRREQKKYLTLIKAIALLHQHQREVKRRRVGDVDLEYIEVIPRDITLANRLAREVLGHSLDELASPTRDLLKQLVKMAARQGSRFTRQDLKEVTGWADWSVRAHLGHLVSLEYVVVVGGGNGRRMTYELLFDSDPEEDRRYLAGLVDVEELLERQAVPENAGR